MQNPPETFVPAETEEAALARACQIWGVQVEFWDIWGSRHVISTESARAVLKSMGVAADTLDELNGALEEQLWNKWANLLPPTLVLSARSGDLAVHIPERLANEPIHFEFHFEGGETSQYHRALADVGPQGEAELRGGRFIEKRLPLPEGSPLGYHHLKASIGDVVCECRLILCPDAAYYPAELIEHRLAGVAVSLYGVRSERNWGCGDFTDLLAIVDWAHRDLQCGFISLNPLHAIPNRMPYNTSPYLPNCSFYRNPLYLDVERMEEFGRTHWAQAILASPAMQSELAGLREAEYVEYEKVWKRKRQFLKLLFRTFLREYKAGLPRALEFRRYVETQGKLLDDFAVYCALDEAIHNHDRNVWIWPDWPEAYRDPESEGTREFAAKHWRSVLFHKWVQWQVELQLEQAQQHARKSGMVLGLYHDLALATDRCGSDLWAHRPFYIDGCRVGAPPDGFSPKGQDWAFPPPNKVRHKDDGYQLFAQSIRNNCQHGGALRIDHVMRFFRLYWIPEGQEATNGVYVRDNADDLVRILALESVRNQVLIVGEDLGTVEPEVRRTLHDFGILSYRLLYFERDGDGSYKLPEEYPRQALISVSTHDLPTLAGYWTNRDIEARRLAGLLPDDASYHEQLAARAAEKQKLLDVFVKLDLVPAQVPRIASEIPEFLGELHNAAIGFLAMSPCKLMCLNQEDLFKDTDQQNLPGSTAEYPNWRHKMRYRIEELRTDPAATACTLMLHDWLARTGRLA